MANPLAVASRSGVFPRLSRLQGSAPWSRRYLAAFSSSAGSAHRCRHNVCNGEQPAQQQTSFRIKDYIYSVRSHFCRTCHVSNIEQGLEVVETPKNGKSAGMHLHTSASVESQAAALATLDWLPHPAHTHTHTLKCSMSPYLRTENGVVHHRATSRVTGVEPAGGQNQSAHQFGMAQLNAHAKKSKSHQK